MSTLDVHPRIASQTSFSRRSRGFILAIAAAIALMLVIAGVMAATHGTSAPALPQHRDMAPTYQFRNPVTHALGWTTPNTQPASYSTP
ncbi:MAG: hypothetical protein ACRDPA_10320 [Solirubrobacteraceae bacterium]